MSNQFLPTNCLFLLCVALPTVVACVYFGLITSDVYVSESRFVVRSPKQKTLTGLGAILQGAGFSQAEDDTYSVHDFILSRDTLQKLNDKLKLDELFSDPKAVFDPERQSAIQMRDKTVGKGASVVVSPWLIQRHRDLWDDPDAFNPDRYANDASRESLKNAYLPFSMGPRVCMGAAFALQEAVLILSSVARNYHLEAVPGHVPQPVGRLTIRSGNGVRLTLHRRPASGVQA